MDNKDLLNERCVYLIIIDACAIIAYYKPILALIWAAWLFNL